MDDVSQAGATRDGAIVVRLGPGRYVLPMAAVAEVGRPPRLTRLPGTPGWLAGAANWRGRVLPVVDVRALLGATVGETAATRLVVLNEDAMSVGLLTDGVDGTMPLTAEPEPPPETLAGPAAGLLAGQVVDDDGPLGVLDVAAVMRLRDGLPRVRRVS